MKRLKLHTRVRLITDGFIAEGAVRGAIGYIIEDYGNEYEVEFSRPDGTTYSQIVVASNNLETVQ